MWQVTGKVPHRAAYCMHSLSKIKHYYRARLRNDLPISGWIPPMSTYTRVLCYLWNYHGDSLYHYTARRCCLYRAMVQVVYLYVVYPTHCHARLGVQYQCESLQVTINGAISRCQRACHQCLPNTLASYMFWSPPIVVHH